MPSQSSLSPSPLRRPSLAQHTSSNQSLSSSSKHISHKPHQVHRPHMVGRAQRNTSVGKNLNKTGRINSTQNVLGDDHGHHKRQRSVPTVLSTSPKDSAAKRNSSHVALPKSTSHVILRKNHSTNSIVRNTSHAAIKKSGLAPAPKQQKGQNKKAARFVLGDKSSDEEEEEDEGAWEDSKTASPELTRSNSITSQHPVTESVHAKVQEDPPPLVHPQPSPPTPSLGNNRSAPNLQKHESNSPVQPSSHSMRPVSPSLLHHQSRATRAPPAISSILAQAIHNGLSRNSSSRSFTHLTHADAGSSNNAPVEARSKSTPGVGGSSSADVGVSHFLPATTPRDQASGDEASDYDSPSNFLPNYHPQRSKSPEKQSIRLRSAKLPNVPSRTQQRLELQRRETMRTSPAPGPTIPTTPPLSFGFRSSTSLHSRSGSRGRNRSAGEETQTIKRDYEAASKQLSVVRKFRDPVMESLDRLRNSSVVPREPSALTPATTHSGKKRPVSRHGTGNSSANGALSKSMSRSLEDRKAPPMDASSSSKEKGRRVMFKRQGSHDDIGLSRSRGSYEENFDDEEELGDSDAVSAEEALVRRMWESREVYDAGDVADA